MFFPPLVLIDSWGISFHARVQQLRCIELDASSIPTCLICTCYFAVFSATGIVVPLVLTHAFLSLHSNSFFREARVVRFVHEIFCVVV